jgi:molybdopterin-guanine dinucleotide biosynthesis protein A
MGRDKALIEVGGVPLAERVAIALEGGGCAPVVLVGGAGERLVAATLRTWLADSHPGQGPLGGVLDAVRWFDQHGAAGVVVAACDLPDLTGDAVRSIADARTAAVACSGDGRPHPSLAYWPVADGHRLASLFESGVRALHQALDALGARRVAVSDTDLRNANTPGDVGD